MLWSVSQLEFRETQGGWGFLGDGACEPWSHKRSPHGPRSPKRFPALVIPDKPQEMSIRRALLHVWPPGGWRSSTGQKTPPDPAPCPFLIHLGFQSLDLKGAVLFHGGRSFCVGGNADLQGLAALWFPSSLFPYTPSSVTMNVMQLRVFPVQIKGIFWNLSLLSFSFFPLSQQTKAIFISKNLRYSSRFRKCRVDKNQTIKLTHRFWSSLGSLFIKFYWITGIYFEIAKININLSMLNAFHLKQALSIIHWSGESLMQGIIRCVSSSFFRNNTILRN